jgi:hypothetical protein
MTTQIKLCSECSFLTDEAYVVAPRLYSSIRFRNKDDIYITHRTPICFARLETESTESIDPISKSEQLHVTVDDPIDLNKHNDCSYFKQTLFPKFRSFIREFLIF